MTDNNNPYDRFYDRIDKDKVKNDLRDNYPNYEELIDYAAKAAIELHIAKYTFQEFINAVFFREFLVAGGSKEELAELDERLKDNPIYQQFKAMKSHEEMIKAWNLNKHRHRKAREAKKIVTEAWSKNVSEFPSAAKAGKHYAAVLEKEHDMSFSDIKVRDWILEYAKEKNIKFR